MSSGQAGAECGYAKTHDGRRHGLSRSMGEEGSNALSAEELFAATPGTFDT
jgi:hypothetical protein